MLPGETLATGASPVCLTCGASVLPIRVLHSAAGYYLGTACACGPYSRESGYYRTEHEARVALDRRTHQRP